MPLRRSVLNEDDILCELYADTRSDVSDNSDSGLEVACWPLEPKFTGSNLAEAVGFFRAKKSSALLTSEEK
jgi:hypothetical protein